MEVSILKNLRHKYMYLKIYVENKQVAQTSKRMVGKQQKIGQDKAT